MCRWHRHMLMMRLEYAASNGSLFFVESRGYSGFQVRIMKLQLHHPKVLVVILLAIASVTAVGLLFASDAGDKESTFTPIPVTGTLSTVSDKDLLEALRVAKASGVIEKINDGQGWTHDYVTRKKFDGVEAVRFDASWENPVESSGPWILFHCQGTRKMTAYAQWTNITRLVVTVDIENDELIAYSPMGDDGNEPVLEVGSHGGKNATVYDSASGDLVFEGTKDELSDFDMCPPGKEEELGK